MAKTFILDGNSILFRSFYATYNYTNPTYLMRSRDGTPTNAIFAFHNFIIKFRNQLSDGDRLVVCFDTGKKTFRSEEFKDYKVQRKPIEPELVTQIPIAHEMLDCMNIFYISKEGYEGDDLAGSFAKYFESIGDDVTIFTSDRDFLQLVDDKITVAIIKKGLTDIQFNTLDNIEENYQLKPKQIIDFKAIAGDSSDNYKGIPGMGEKTTIPLLQKYGDIETIYEHISELKPGVQKKFTEYKNDCMICRRIATIITDIDVKEYEDKSFVKHPDVAKLKEFYDKYSLDKFSAQLEKENSTTVPQQKQVKSKLHEKVEISSFADIKGEVNSIYFSLNGTNENNSEILGLIFSTKDKNYFYPSFYLNNVDEALTDYLKSDKPKNTYDSKSLNVILNRLNLPFANTIENDILLAEYVLNPDFDSNVNILIEDNLDVDVTTLDATDKAIAICQVVSQVKDYYHDKITKEKQVDLYKNIEIPLSLVLAKMEIEGIPCDKKFLAELNDKYKKIIADIRSKILVYCSDKNINLNSPTQISKLLFDELQLGKNLKKKSTSIDTLKAIENEHEVVSLLMDYRKYTKLISAYTESLPKYITPDGKIHAIFNQALTSTGRLSMSDPNLQTISIRTEEGKEMRKAFYYEDGYKLVSFDYSQIELRVLAHIANIEHLIDVFNKDLDIHRATASKIFNVPLDEVTSSMRRNAKAVNFGIIYGISVYGLSVDLNISYQEAKAFMDNFKKTFPEIDEYQNKVIQYAKNHGYVKTIFNRVRYLKDINSPDFQVRSFSERAAINTTIQGSAADLIKVAMVELDKKLKDYNTKMILQIHDELIFKVPDEEVAIVMPIIKETMENAVKLRCKLVCEGSQGKTWFDLK